MNMKTETIEKNVQKDIDVLAEFIHIYCVEKHAGTERARPKSAGDVGRYLASVDFDLCAECAGLLLHAVSKRVLCLYDTKPACKKCPTHCYGPGHRDKIREVMRYSGMCLIMRGRLGLMKKYFS
ncbi:MAG: hypothetical protein A2176_03800 [Spirochaetes bacterium RBG_13_51_14]|nr:MAG: hypothetical protein A2176_03800 [Spirochaetes bacterium RBG_13_51_14]